MRENAYMRACMCVYAHFYSARVSSREVAAVAEIGGRRKERETSMLGPCGRHGSREWSWDLRLSEYIADKRKKERSEKERDKEIERGEVQIRSDERQPRMTLY